MAEQATARLQFRRRLPGEPGYTVSEDRSEQGKATRFLGYVKPVAMPSHIRPDKSQSSSWWIAFGSSWQQVEIRDGHGHRVDRWQTRREAGEALYQWTEERRA